MSSEAPRHLGISGILRSSQVELRMKKESPREGIWPVCSNDVSFLEGQLLTLAESWGGEPQILKSRKNLLSQTLWSWMVDIEMTRETVELVGK